MAPASSNAVEWLLFGGATLILAVAGSGFYRSAVAAARRGTTNMDTLIAIGATTAYLFSLALFAGRLLRQVARFDGRSGRGFIDPAVARRTAIDGPQIR